MKNPGIYILTNQVNGIQYVGKDSRLPSRANQHLRGQNPDCPAIHEAMKKYGNENFSVEIIQYPGISDEALNAVERWKIRQLHTRDPKGYNLTDGGDGGSLCEKTRQKISEAQKERIANGTHNLLGDNNPMKRPEVRQKMSENNPMKRPEVRQRSAEAQKGRKHSDETKQKMSEAQKRPEVRQRKSEANKGRTPWNKGKPHSEETCQKISKTKKGGKLTPEHRQNISEGLRGENNPAKRPEVRHKLSESKKGENNPMYGKKQSEEHRQNISEAIKRLAKEGKHPRTIKRRKAEWCYIIALSRFWYEIHDYTLKRRSEFLSKAVPDMSNAEQEYLF